MPETRDDGLRRIATVAAAVTDATDLTPILDLIVHAAAAGAEMETNSILLLDDDGCTLRHAAAVGLPDAYTAAIDGVAIGPQAGTCGVAAWGGEAVVTEDLRVDPNWDAYRHLAVPYGWRAVWSFPLRGNGGRVLGTFAAYHTRPGAPTDAQRELLTLYAYLAAGAVERVRALQRLQANEDRFRALVEHGNDLVSVVDQGGIYRYVSPSHERILGFKPDDTVGQSAASFVHPDDLVAVRGAFEPLTRPGAAPVTFEYRRRHADGSWRVVEATASNRLDDPSVQGIIFNSRDVTARRQAEEMRRRVYEAIAGGVLVTDREGRILDANAAAEEILGVPLNRMRGLAPSASLWGVKNLEGFTIPPDQCPSTVALRTGKSVRGAMLRIIRPDGQDRCLQVDAVPLRDEGGAIDRLVISYVDFTPRLRAEAALRESEELFRGAFANATIGMSLTSIAEGRYLQINQALCTILGYTEAELLGMTWRDVGHPDDLEISLQAMRSATTGERGIACFEKRYAHKRGHIIWVQVSLSVVRAANGRPTCFIAHVQDITERKRMEEDLWHQALHDALTGLPNRASLLNRIERAVEAARGQGSSAEQPGSLALLLLDLDRFKEVNDTFGHRLGDALLPRVAERLRRVIRSTDIVARLGGDEFALLLPAGTRSDAVGAAVRIRAALDAPFVVEGQTLHLSGSIGIALCPEHGTDGETLLRHADIAMYVAKRSGESYAMYTPEQDQYSPERLALMSELRQAIERGELILHYQPKIDLATGKVVGVEALVRWPHPRRGLIRPDVFIPLAEYTGLIVPLTQRVLEMALSQCRSWHDAGLRFSVAVNLSTVSLHDPHLPDTIARLLDGYGVRANALRLEVTESTLMADTEMTRNVLARLAALGVGISVDDYGKSYSSLAYLKRLPVDELKIDMSFVRHMVQDETDAAIVASTIGLGHSLGLHVVAEGVENRETCQALVAMGCDVMQGYYVSPPVPANELECFLRDTSWKAA